jgi:2-dehydropantoate 2-reductase
MKIMVLGAGGVGGYFGGRLAENGADVTFLVREKRRVQLERDGLRIESVHGNVSLPVRAVSAGQVRPEYDVMIVACKAYDLSSAIEAAGPAVSSGGCILPLLNGIGHLEILNKYFGPHRVLGGLAKIAVTLTSEGIVKHLNDWKAITFGEQDGTISERVKALEAAFPAAAVEARAVDDILQQMWEKLVHIATAAAMTCLMRASVGDIVRTPDGAWLFRRMLDLNAEVAARQGHWPSRAFMEYYGRIFSDPGSAYTTSMLRDVEAGRRTESEQIIGFMLEKARAASLDAGLLEIAYTHLRAYENRREPSG